MALQINLLKLNKYPQLFYCVQSKFYGKYCSIQNLKQCYNVLGIAENSDQEKIRAAYLNLAKKYHPDTKTPLSDPAKFAEIDKAFRILMNKQCREKWEIEEIKINEAKECDIKHCAPQHRQYLSYDGIGAGTIFQRQKQFTKKRAAHAAENVMNHRLKKISAKTEEKSLWASQKHEIKTKYGYERVVEDLIQQAMKRGEFNNLKGSGKPLPYTSESCNPYVDFVTHKLNQVLIDNGFTPEWIMLQKDIRQEKQNLKRNLYKDRTHFGEYPLDETETYKWDRLLVKYQKDVDEINKKIRKYNLVVPALQTQFLQMTLDKIADKILKYGQTRKEFAILHHKTDDPQKNPQSIFSFIETFMLKNRRY